VDLDSELLATIPASVFVEMRWTSIASLVFGVIVIVHNSNRRFANFWNFGNAKRQPQPSNKTLHSGHSFNATRAFSNNSIHCPILPRTFANMVTFRVPENFKPFRRNSIKTAVRFEMVHVIALSQPRLRIEPCWSDNFVKMSPFSTTVAVTTDIPVCWIRPSTSLARLANVAVLMYRNQIFVMIHYAFLTRYAARS